MSYALFDCTQLLTFSSYNEDQKVQLKNVFEGAGFNVIFQNEIETKKIQYFKDLEFQC